MRLNNWFGPVIDDSNDGMKRAVKRAAARGHTRESIGLISSDKVGYQIYRAMISEGVRVHKLFLHVDIDMRECEKPSKLEKLAVALYSTFDELGTLMRQAESSVSFFVMMNHSLLPLSIVNRYATKREGSYNLVNIHPSLLPDGAGEADPLAKRIRDGYENAWLTMHKVTRQIDGGPIIGYMPFRIPEKVRESRVPMPINVEREFYCRHVFPAAARLTRAVLERQPIAGISQDAFYSAAFVAAAPDKFVLVNPNGR